MTDTEKIRNEAFRLNQEAIRQVEWAREQGEEMTATMWQGRAGAYSNICTFIDSITSNNMED